MDLECYAFIDISVLTKCGQDKYQNLFSFHKSAYCNAIARRKKLQEEKKKASKQARKNKRKK